jgi:hypothetical protein
MPVMEVGNTALASSSLEHTCKCPCTVCCRRWRVESPSLCRDAMAWTCSANTWRTAGWPIRSTSRGSRRASSLCCQTRAGYVERSPFHQCATLCPTSSHTRTGMHAHPRCSGCADHCRARDRDRAAARAQSRRQRSRSRAAVYVGRVHDRVRGCPARCRRKTGGAAVADWRCGCRGYPRVSGDDVSSLCMYHKQPTPYSVVARCE